MDHRDALDWLLNEILPRDPVLSLADYDEILNHVHDMVWAGHTNGPEYDEVLLRVQRAAPEYLPGVNNFLNVISVLLEQFGNGPALVEPLERLKDRLQGGGLSVLEEVLGEINGDHKKTQNQQQQQQQQQQAAKMSRDNTSTTMDPPQDPWSTPLLLDVPYIIQGLHTKSYEWTAEGIEMDKNMPIQLVSLVSEALEPALLYRQIREYLDTPTSGLTAQALKGVVEQELRNYLGVVSVLESEIRNKGDVTLRRCVLLLKEATLALRVLFGLLRDCSGLLGGQILSVVYKLTFDGEETVSKFASRILILISASWNGILRQWLSHGVLNDPYGDFFVTFRTSESDAEYQELIRQGKGGDRSGLFTFDKSNIPEYIPEKVAKQIFATGKSLYFVRVDCGLANWVERRKVELTAEEITDLRVCGSLKKLVDSIYQEVVSYLNTVLRDKFHLDDHLQGIKSYLLIGQGDFFQTLLDNISPTLARPSNTLFRHDLTSALEASIRESNARFDKEWVLRNLDARILELGHGALGWDVFTLEYHLQPPLEGILMGSMEKKSYLRIFNFLWRIKRVSHALNNGWRRMRIQSFANPQNSLSTIWPSLRLAMAQMIHFINELQYYIIFEVIETSWTKLQHKLVTQVTVDELQNLHQQFLQDIMSKGLLHTDNLVADLHSLLKHAIKMSGLVDGVFEIQYQILTGADGDYDDRLETLSEQIALVQRGFEQGVVSLLRVLRTVRDEDVQFLTTRLDFNGYYHSSV
ncbi:Spc98 family-domain-containing protein [Yarrowia lipolytica]|nr:Spc98 family-domain-containing protein [Yarrowia lipolytica]